MAQYITFQPSDHFNTKLYTGNGSTNNITGVGFDPDWVWAKSRAVEVHELYDKVRGAGKRIQSQSTAGENSEGYQSFITDGFAWSGSGNCNANGVNYVSWNWKANGQGSSNTDGSINTTYTSVNTTAGISISTYSGTGSAATIGHGLGVAPKVVIIKNTYQTENWVVGHNSIGFTKFLQLNTTAVEATSSTRFNDTAPTSSVFSVGTETQVNQAGGTHVAYCFAEKNGFSKFDSYTGNANADGPFVYTGFKPAFVMIKGYQSGGSDNWNIIDNGRAGYNAANYRLFANSNATANTTSIADILSTGFKLRVSSTDVNADGNSYIYMAFAEHPIVSSNDIPGTAR